MNKHTNIKPVVKDIRKIISNGVLSAYSYTSKTIIETYWNVGRRIVEEEQKGVKRAEYGKLLIEDISKELVKEFGKGYSARNLRNMRQFYMYFPENKIWQTRLPNLTWSHLLSIIRINDEKARIWYLNETSKNRWSVRTLNRNISTQYYNRLIKSPNMDLVIKDMKDRTNGYLTSIEEIIKSPMIAEFLGFRNDQTYIESDLENAIINHLRDFMMEMGNSFSYVGRQQHIKTETSDYYIDLVFYDIKLKCYVLIDLKIGQITHQDIGQMDMYIRMYDNLVCDENDNPTIGIVLCSETDKDLVRYSILNDNNNLYMSKYLLYMPTKEQLKREINKQKEIYEKSLL